MLNSALTTSFVRTLLDFIQLSLEVVVVSVLEPTKRCPTDPPTIKKRCVIQAIFEYMIAYRQKSIDCANVCSVAAGIQQRAWSSQEFRKLQLEIVMRGGVSADEVRCAASGSPFLSRVRKCFGNTRISCETQVVVAAEV